MKKLNSPSLQYDLHSILEARVLLQCKEVEGKHFMEWVVSENPFHKIAYHYPDRASMMHDHYRMSSYYFMLKIDDE